MNYIHQNYKQNRSINTNPFPIKNRVSSALALRFSRDNCQSYLKEMVKSKTKPTKFMDTLKIEEENQPFSSENYAKCKIYSSVESKTSSSQIYQENSQRKNLQVSKNSEIQKNENGKKCSKTKIKHSKRFFPIEYLRKSVEEKTVSQAIAVFRVVKERNKKMEKNNELKLKDEQKRIKSYISEKRQIETINPTFSFEGNLIPINDEPKTYEFQEHFIEVKCKLLDNEDKNKKKILKKIQNNGKMVSYTTQENELLLKNRTCSWNYETYQNLEPYSFYNSEFMQNFNNSKENYHLPIFEEGSENKGMMKIKAKETKHRKSISMLEERNMKIKNCINVENKSLFSEELLLNKNERARDMIHV